nr:unnamed protein product [Callosobruchus analis]
MQGGVNRRVAVPAYSGITLPAVVTLEDPAASWKGPPAGSEPQNFAQNPAGPAGGGGPGQPGAGLPNAGGFPPPPPNSAGPPYNGPTGPFGSPSAGGGGGPPFGRPASSGPPFVPSGAAAAPGNHFQHFGPGFGMPPGSPFGPGPPPGHPMGGPPMEPGPDTDSWAGRWAVLSLSNKAGNIYPAWAKEMSGITIEVKEARSSWSDEMKCPKTDDKIEFLREYITIMRCPKTDDKIRMFDNISTYPKRNAAIADPAKISKDEPDRVHLASRASKQTTWTADIVVTLPRRRCGKCDVATSPAPGSSLICAPVRGEKPRDSNVADVAAPVPRLFDNRF